MGTKLEQLRGELAVELRGLILSRGVRAPKTDAIEVPVFSGADGLGIFRNTETVYMVRLASVLATIPKGQMVERITIETDLEYHYLEDLFADDIDALVTHIKQMTDRDLYQARKFYDEYNS